MKFSAYFLFCFTVFSMNHAVLADALKSELHSYKYEVLLNQKSVIWGFDFLPDGRIIFSLREGSLKIFDPKTKTVTDLKGLPKVWPEGQGGLLDVRVHPKIQDRIYISYSELSGKNASTAVGFGTLKNDALVDFEKIFTGNNASRDGIHFGSRIEFDGKGFLYISLGERNDRDRAQSLQYHNGKIVRLKEDGSVPTDNPFTKTSNAKPEIWTYGHRNPQGLALNPQTQELWSSEMGPRGGDELNLIKSGLNYGWPIVTYGREYYGPKIGEGVTKPGIEAPIAHWVPSISPSGMTFYSGNAFPKWKNNLFMGTLSGSHLRRLTMNGTEVQSQEILLKDLSLRIRNVRTGPDGFLYLATDSGYIARLVPALK